MPTSKLTNRMVEAATAGGRDAFFWDSELRGFGLKVTPSGSKIYLVQYRMGGRGSPTRRYTIGRHGTWSPQTARDEAVRLLREAESGVDPQSAAKAREYTEQDLAFDSYAERFLRDFGKRKWRPRTYSSAESNLRRWVIPVLRRKPLPSITRPDITSVFDKLPPGSPALPRNIFNLVRKLFSWSVERGDLNQSPLNGMPTPSAVTSRDRVLDDHELILVAAMAGDLNPPFGQFVRMLIATGQRRDEVSGMAWNELDQRTAEWRLPPARTKNNVKHLVPLNSIAMRELDALAGGERWPTNGYVFTTTGRSPVSGYSRMKRQLDALISLANGGRPIASWRLHDLRRTFATNMQRLDVRFEVTEALLNHISGSRAGVGGIYQRHDWGPEKADAVARWASKLHALVDQSHLSLNAVP